MDLIDVLRDAKIDLYKSEAIISSCNGDISTRIRNDAMNKYRSKIITVGDVQYKVHGAIVNMPYHRSRSETKLTLKLFMVCVSKTTKAKRLKIEEAKKEFKDHNHIPWCNYKVKMWGSLTWECDIKTSYEQGVDLSFMNARI